VNVIFSYMDHPPPDVVAVELFWSADGTKCGSIRLPEQVTTAITTLDYPIPARDMSFESAVAYGVYLALRAELPIAVTGDRSVWNEHWGTLVDVPVSGRPG
jgi:hypothetical protein